MLYMKTSGQDATASYYGNLLCSMYSLYPLLTDEVQFTYPRSRGNSEAAFDGVRIVDLRLGGHGRQGTASVWYARSTI